MAYPSYQSVDPSPLEFNKIKVGVKTLDDADVRLGDQKRHNPMLADKGLIYKALAENDLPLLRQISNYFYKTSGLY
mgnify:FL=1